MKKAFLTATIAVALAAFAVPASGTGTRAEVGSASVDRAGASALGLEITGTSEPDEISLTIDSSQAQYVLTSTHEFEAPPPQCTQPGSTFEMRCPTSQFASFKAILAGGNDTFTVGPSVTAIVQLIGQDGLDDLIGGRGSDSLFGGNGADRLVGNRGPDTLLGGRNGDILNGGMGRDVLKGGKGNDQLRGGPGRDSEKQ